MYAVAYTRNLPRPEDTRDLFAIVEARAGVEPIYVFAGAVPAWTFYTTRWDEGGSRSRVDWFRRVTASPSVAFYNLPSRGHPISREGDSLTTQYRGRTEVIGIGTGMEFRIRNDGAIYSRLHPDEGWAENEARRIRAVADSAAWLALADHAPVEEATLLAALRRSGAMVSDSISRPGAAIYRVRWRVDERRGVGDAPDARTAGAGSRT
jgi:hypothetical protein